MKRVIIHTDGACKGNPGKGGWGAVLEYDGNIKEIFGTENPTTNNRMELTAAIESLSILKNTCYVDIYTDSRYLQQGITIWMRNWVRKNWISSNNTPVKNRDLWEKLNTLTAKHHVTWHWLKGHNKHSLNDRADALANKGLLNI